MTINDVRFYGACTDGLTITLYANEEEIKKQGKVLCEVSLERGFRGNKYVLRFDWINSTTTYKPIYDNTYYKDGYWQSIAEMEDVPKRFFELYDKVYANKNVKSIFDMTFYGVASYFAFGRGRINIWAKCAEVFSKNRSGDEIFTAKVLESFEGENYVVKLDSENGYTEYVSLFDFSKYYNDDQKTWMSLAIPSDIPAKIMQCYIEYMNNGSKSDRNAVNNLG